MNDSLSEKTAFKTVDEMFDEIACAYPDLPALIESGTAITYGELNRKSSILAATLQERGIGPDIPVGINICRSINYIVALLAVLKSGACYVPLDPEYPLERLKFVVENTRCSLVLSESSRPALTAPEHRLDLDVFTWQSAEQSGEVPAARGNLAYILYTSGSTGKPKGVEIEHRNLSNLVNWHHATFPEELPYRASQAARTGFDASVWEIWSHLTRGGTLCFVPEELLLQPQPLAEWLYQNDIVECFLPTPMAEMMLDFYRYEDTKLKYLHSGGDRLTRKPPAEFPAVLTNLYGPTECTVIATWSKFAPGSDDGKMPDIGCPVDNCEVRIVDENLREVAAGEDGEICVCGAGVGRGYHRNEEQTTAVFIDDIFNPGGRMYLTGDLGRKLADGRIEFIGRKDFQLKIRGFRIEPGEIEAVINRHPAVTVSVVAGCKSPAGGKFLAAYVVTKQSIPDIESALRNKIRKYLPEYMEPTAFVFLEKMPLTTNGKIDRSALPEPQLCAAGSESLQTPTENRLSDIWNDLLKTGMAGRDDNFFRLGGDSLLATRLILEISERFNVTLSMHAVFNHPTLHEQAALIDQAAGNNEFLFTPVIHRSTCSRTRYPLSEQQRGILMMEKNSSSGNLFNIPLVITLRGPVKRELLEVALHAVITKHETLRAGFEFNGDQLMQFFMPESNLVPEFHDFTELPVDESNAQWRELQKRQRNRAFELDNPPLIHAIQVKLSDVHWKLLITVHHLVFDGWSSTIFFRELGEHYRCLLDGSEPALKQGEAITYGDFVLWQQEYLRSADAGRCLTFWRKQLQQMNPPPSLPSPIAVSDNHDRRGGRFYLEIPAELTGRLKVVAANYHATLFMVLNAALQTQLHRYSGAVDITTGTSIAGRNNAGAAEVIGLFINALPIRNSFFGKPGFSDVLKRMRQSTLDAYENQDLPFDTLLSDFHRHHPGGAIFKVSLLLQNLPYDRMQLADIAMSFEETGNDTSKLDLMITFEERDGGLHGWFEYDARKFTSAVVEETATAYLALLEQIAEKPEQRVADYHCPLPLSVSGEQSCYVIGETSLMAQCVEALIEKGITPLGCFSPDEKIRHWIQRLGIPCYEANRELLKEILAIRPFDYLFSVINGMILDAGVLAMPCRRAINYHDAPLPAYGGMHATSWALLNGESQHGISWHDMSEAIDAGAILASRQIAISSEDTAMSLNLKCATAALDTFNCLIDALLDDKISPVLQPDEGRSYYGRFTRPDNGCLIDWNQNCKTIVNLIRSLDFGTYDNPLGVAKFGVAGKFYAAMTGKPDASSNRQPPGTVLEVTGKSITVAADSGAVILSDIKTLDGQPINPEQAGIASGEELMRFSREALHGLSENYQKQARREDALVKLLRSPALPESSLLGKSSQSASRSLSIREFPAALTTCCASNLLAPVLFNVFLARLIDREELDIGVALTPEVDAIFAPLFFSAMPFRVTVDFDDTLVNNLKRNAATLEKLIVAGPCFADLALRRHAPAMNFPCIVKMDNTLCEVALPEDADFEIIWHIMAVFLDNAAKDVSRPLGEIPLLNTVDTQRVLYEWNNTGRDFKLDKTYIEHFVARATAMPDAVAVQCGEATLTYRQLNQSSNCLARHLLDKGISGNAIIGICLGRSCNLAAALLGIFKAGCAYLPLDPHYPEARLLFMLRDARAGFVLVDDNSKNLITRFDGVTVLNLCDLPLFDHQIDYTMPEIAKHPDDLAYVMYTSGSTGLPKGVMITQSNLLNHNFGVIQDYQLTGSDRILQCGSISFDLSAEEIFPTWLAGATLVFRPDGPMGPPEWLCRFIQQHRITVLDLPTAYWRELTDCLETLQLPDSVRLTVIGGESASQAHFDLWHKYTKNIRLINSYGPTETTIIATWSETAATIGRPVANTQVYILNRRLQPQPPGVPGELCIGGSGVARGYLGRPELSAIKFIANPFVAGGKIYRSGDIAALNSSGEIVFAGRIDNQIKINGFRIEPGDIESALRRQPMILDALVMPRDDSSGRQWLVAYVLTVGAAIDEETIRKKLRHELPGYSIPARIVKLDAFPLTPNGKIDRQALPLPDLSNHHADGVFEHKPTSNLEMQLQLVFQKLLGRDYVNPEIGFFDLGGDSLKAIHLLLEMEKLTGRHLNAETVYGNSSIRGLCRSLMESQTGWSELVPLKMSGDTDKNPLFLIHTTPGDIFGYLNMIKHLDERPVYGIQALGLKNLELAHHDIFSMADYYVSLVRDKHPNGPYLLGGWCFGGIVALEMARKLRLAGEPVAFLGLIETWGKPRRSPRFLLERAFDLVRWGPEGWWDYLRFKWSQRVAKNKATRLDFLRENVGWNNHARMVEEMVQLYKINMNAFDKYIMEPYDGKIHLFQGCGYMPGVIPTLWYDWKLLANNLEIYRCDGGHAEILHEPYVRDLTSEYVARMTTAEKNAEY